MQPARVGQQMQPAWQTTQVSATLGSHVRGMVTDNTIGATETGIIARFNMDKGFGFVKPSDGSDTIYCNKKNLLDIQDALVGDQVTYTRSWDKRSGKPEALNVKLIPGSVRGGGEHGVGTVVHWNWDKNFGFIQPMEGGDEIFSNSNHLVGTPGLEKGDVVTYTKRFNGRKGKYEAYSVSLAESLTPQTIR